MFVLNAFARWRHWSSVPVGAAVSAGQTAGSSTRLVGIYSDLRDPGSHHRVSVSAVLPRVKIGEREIKMLHKFADTSIAQLRIIYKVIARPNTD